MTNKKNLMVLAPLLAAVILMASPVGAVLKFSFSPGKSVLKSFSYFDFSVIGMSGNLFPFITAVLSSLLTFFCIINIVAKTQVFSLSLLMTFSIVSFLTSVLALLMFFNFSLAGIIISLLLAVVSALIFGLM